MSSEYIKTITIKSNGEVWMSSYSSNVYPKKARKWLNTYAMDFWKQHGLEALENDFMEQYKGGMFYGDCTEYAKAVRLNMSLYDYRQAKKDKALYVVKSGEYFVMKFGRRNAKICRSIENALKLKYIDAVFKIKSYSDLTLEKA